MAETSLLRILSFRQFNKRFCRRLLIRLVAGVAILSLFLVLFIDNTGKKTDTIIKLYRKIDTPLPITEIQEKMVINDFHKGKVLVQSDKQNTTESSSSKLTTVGEMTAAEKIRLNELMQRDSQVLESTSSLNKNLTLLYGKQRGKRGFLSIGIPTVSRSSNKRGYLDQTLHSLIENTSDEDKEEVTVVIYVADFNNSWNLMTAQNIYNTYKKFCDLGFINVIHAKSIIYPQFSKLERRFNDPIPRVVWRSKQNINFALLMWYTKNISIYYMQLEDDVISAKSFLTDIKKFILQQPKQDWIYLEFSRLGFIGKLFKANVLEKVSNFLLTFFDIMPCDLLLGFLRTLFGQKKPIHIKQSLFQHIGKISSLKNKILPLIDDTFKDVGSQVLDVMRVPKGDNPHAKIETNMKASSVEFLPEYAYNNSTSFFWGSDPGKGKYYRIIYDKPFNISRIIVSTGDRMKKKDILNYGSLSVGKTQQCNNLTVVADFAAGYIDTFIQGVTFLPSSGNIQCVSIDINKSQKNWLIIDKISVFIKK